VAVRGDGSVWSWGTNGLDFETTLVPRKVEGLENIRTVSVSWLNAYALGTDGTLWQWFEYGPGPVPPAQVEGITNVVAVAATDLSSLHVVRADGTVWSQGFNSYGVLGVPGVTRSQSWLQVPGLTDAVSLSMNSMEPRVLAVRANGTAVSWGSNLRGAIGDGISPVHLTPTRVLMPCRLPAVPSWEESQGEAQRCHAEP
jgi:alpha-tubulin suppressor-like RCC1 family protein